LLTEIVDSIQARDLAALAEPSHNAEWRDVRSKEPSMNARHLVAALMLLGLPGRLPAHGGLIVDLPLGGPRAKGELPRANQRTGPAQDAAATANSKPLSRAADQTQRVRELMYFFRNYRVFCRDEEWAKTIRELATIGKPAVPELIAELDRTDRDATLRSLAFTLRAIGDPRAVPALVRAIPKALRPPGSDCAVLVVDPELRAFMKAHDYDKDDRSDYVYCGRPVNEILSALERITKHREPPDVGDRDPLRKVFLRGTPEQEAQQRAMFEERHKRWEAWWKDHWREFVSQDELESVDLPRRDRDLVELAGVARYGPLFPTGPRVRLGPVRMLRLTTWLYRNGKSHLDLDTARVFEIFEGLTKADRGQRADFTSRITTWYRQSGIDIRCQGTLEGQDLQLWLIDNSRWDTVDKEIQKNEPLKLGREVTDTLARFNEIRTGFQYDELATFLFTTREGARGIVQVFPKDPDTDRVRLRYRLWLTSPASPKAQSPVAEVRNNKPRGTPFGETATITLDLPVAAKECLLNFKTGRKALPPEFLKADELAEAFSLGQNQRLIGWCREHAIDAFGAAETARAKTAPAPFAKSEPPESQVALIGLDMLRARILPQSFDDMSVEGAREILDRILENQSGTMWMEIDPRILERPDTFAFKTREGTVGILQLLTADIEARTLKVRYRLEPRKRG
jgi:hypothetical protein